LRIYASDQYISRRPTDVHAQVPALDPTKL
jgi:hypothetical protein